MIDFKDIESYGKIGAVIVGTVSAFFFFYYKVIYWGRDIKLLKEKVFPKELGQRLVMVDDCMNSRATCQKNQLQEFKHISEGIDRIEKHNVEADRKSSIARKEIGKNISDMKDELKSDISNLQVEVGKLHERTKNTDHING